MPPDARIRGPQRAQARAARPRPAACDLGVTWTMAGTPRGKRGASRVDAEDGNDDAGDAGHASRAAFRRTAHEPGGSGPPGPFYSEAPARGFGRGRGKRAVPRNGACRQPKRKNLMDTVSPERRSEIMRRIRGKDTAA
jgi:hypothetical protein